MSLVCTECFEDKYLKKHIVDNGSIDDCDFCESNKVACVQATDLKPLFDPLIDLYTSVDEFIPTYDLKENDHGGFIGNVIDDEWWIFSDKTCSIRESIIEAIYVNDYIDGMSPSFLDSRVMREDEYWGDDEVMHSKMEEEWEKFCYEIIHVNRFFPQNTIDEQLIMQLLKDFATENLDMNHDYWRARSSENLERIMPKKMGSPPKEKSTDGRANPKGIPYLYIAEDEKTAISEIRPLINSKVTTGKFKVTGKYEVADLREFNIDSPFNDKYSGKLNVAVRCVGMLRKLCDELSKRVDPMKNGLEYIPLQYLCELIKKEGFEGVMYESAIADGYNVALFNDSKIECTRTYLQNINSINYGFTPVTI